MPTTFVADELTSTNGRAPPVPGSGTVGLLGSYDEKTIGSVAERPDRWIGAIASASKLFDLPHLYRIRVLVGLWPVTDQAFHQIGILREEDFGGGESRRPAGGTPHAR